MRVVDKIQALRRQGKTEREIARALGIKRNSVTSLESRERQRASRRGIPVHVDANLHLDLEREARIRQVAVPALLHSLIAVVVRDRLFAAILDE